MHVVQLARLQRFLDCNAGSRCTIYLHRLVVHQLSLLHERVVTGALAVSLLGHYLPVSVGWITASDGRARTARHDVHAITWINLLPLF